MSPPDRIVFEPADHFTPEYREALEALGESIALVEEQSLAEAYSVFHDTLDQLRILEAVENILARADAATPRPGVATAESELREDLRAAASRVRQVILDNRWVDGAPLEVEVDERRRLHLVKWRRWTGEGWTGPFLVREVPMAPEMHLVVAASVDQPSEGGRYGYRLHIGESSRGRTGAVWVECAGLTEGRLAELSRRRDPQTRIELDGRPVRAALSLPDSGYLQDFRLRLYDLERDLMVSGKPGETLDFPALVEVPWPQLPGIVRVWVEVGRPGEPSGVGRYPGGISAERDPPNALDAFSNFAIVPTPQTGAKKVPRWMYQGFTLGPVPAPDSSTPLPARIASLSRSFDQAMELGWCPDARFAQRIADGLAQASDDSSIRGLLSLIERGYEEQALLREAYLLLKLNLSHTLSRQ